METNGHFLNELPERLLRCGLISSKDATLIPLSGGVSSEIYLVKSGENCFVVKRALPKLKVQDEWYADPARNKVEWACLQYLDTVRQGSVPCLLHHEPEHGWFAMEYLGEDFKNWKSLLLKGVLRGEDAARAGRLLGLMHAGSWGDDSVKHNFNTLPNFYSLRIEPYLLTTGQRHPELQTWFAEEAERLAGMSQALVHGDFSPKNILLNEDRLVILDGEVAWYGDPAFDVAFLLNHIFLKALHRAGKPGDYLGMALKIIGEYQDALNEHYDESLEKRISRLLVMLMLARVAGKSPVEYLTAERQKNVVRDFAQEWVPRDGVTLNELVDAWWERVCQTFEQ